MFQRIRGYLICQNRTYGLGDTNFRSLDIFLNKRITGFRESSPELVAGVGEEGRRSCGRSSLTSSRRRTAKMSTREVRWAMSRARPRPVAAWSGRRSCRTPTSNCSQRRRFREGFSDGLVSGFEALVWVPFIGAGEVRIERFHSCY